MSDDEYQLLKSDIAENGLREPIALWKGQLLDGRHRLKACKELKIEPTTRDLPESIDPVTWVISTNIHRRHLTTQQKAMVAGRFAEALKEPAKQRKVEAGKVAGKKGGRGRNRVTANLPEPYSPSANGESRQQAATLLGVSARSVGDAQTILKQGSAQLQRMVDAGEVSISKAAKVAREHEGDEQVSAITASPSTKKKALDYPEFTNKVNAMIEASLDTWSKADRDMVCQFFRQLALELRT